MRGAFWLLVAMACSSSDDDIPCQEETACDQVPEFRLGGAVANLTATLVLDNSGKDTVTVIGDGAFAFPRLLADTTLYTVAIAEQPAGQSCVVANGAGQIAGDHVDDIEVTCGAVSTATIQCSGAVACSKVTQFCCFDRDAGAGTCTDEGTSCRDQRIECDSTEDCGGGASACCASYEAGALISATCVSDESRCTDHSEFEFWCDPDAPMPCPSGRSCTGSSNTTGYAICE